MDDVTVQIAEMKGHLRFLLLGSLELRDGHRQVPVGAPRMRTLLAILLLEPNRVVSLQQILDALWGENHPRNALATAHTYISRLRRVLGEAGLKDAARIVPDGRGYRLAVDERLIDVVLARSLLRQAAALPAGQRLTLLSEAGRLWRGPELADLHNPVDVTDLTQLRIAVRDALNTELQFHDTQAWARLSKLLSGLDPGAADNTGDPLAIWPAGGVDTAVRIESITASIYLSDEAGHVAVEAAVTQAMELAGAPIVERDDPILGSWFRRMRANQKAREIGMITAHAAETRLVHAPDAEVTATLLQHIGPVITALQMQKEAVVRLGAVLIVKVGDQLVIHQLTATQQFQLDHHPQLALAPRDILGALGLPPTSNGCWQDLSASVEKAVEEDR